MEYKRFFITMTGFKVVSTWTPIKAEVGDGFFWYYLNMWNYRSERQTLVPGNDSASINTVTASATLRNKCSFKVVYKSSFLKLDIYHYIVHIIWNAMFQELEREWKYVSPFNRRRCWLANLLPWGLLIINSKKGRKEGRKKGRKGISEPSPRRF